MYCHCLADKFVVYIDRVCYELHALYFRNSSTSTWKARHAHFILRWWKAYGLGLNCAIRESAKSIDLDFIISVVIGLRMSIMPFKYPLVSRCFIA